VTDYYSLIARAVAGLEGGTSESRRAVYDRARKVQVLELGNIHPPLSESAIKLEFEALEKAIRKVEDATIKTEQAVSDAKRR
jgi:hypothetical protein